MLAARLPGVGHEPGWRIASGAPNLLPAAGCRAERVGEADAGSVVQRLAGATTTATGGARSAPGERTAVFDDAGIGLSGVAVLKMN